MKKAQGMSMQTIVIIILAVIILAAVTILFFTQFGANKKNFGNFSDVGSNKTEDAVGAANDFSPVASTNTFHELGAKVIKDALNPSLAEA